MVLAACGTVNANVFDNMQNNEKSRSTGSACINVCE